MFRKCPAIEVQSQLDFGLVGVAGKRRPSRGSFLGTHFRLGVSFAPELINFLVF